MAVIQFRYSNIYDMNLAKWSDAEPCDTCDPTENRTLVARMRTWRPNH